MQSRILNTGPEGRTEGSVGANPGRLAGALKGEAIMAGDTSARKENNKARSQGRCVVCGPSTLGGRG